MFFLLFDVFYKIINHSKIISFSEVCMNITEALVFQCEFKGHHLYSTPNTPKEEFEYFKDSVIGFTPQDALMTWFGQMYDMHCNFHFNKDLQADETRSLQEFLSSKIACFHMKNDLENQLTMTARIPSINDKIEYEFTVFTQVKEQ